MNGTTARDRHLERQERTLGSATRRQERIEPLHPTAQRILVLCRENGAVLIGESGVAVISLVAKGLALVTPMGAGRFRVEATDAGLEAIEHVSYSNQDQKAERKANLRAAPRSKPEGRVWR